MKKTLFLIFLFSYILALASVKVSVDGKIVSVNSVSVRGMEYLSARDFAKKLGAGFFYNSKTKKCELKINDYRIVLTAWNQFIIMRKRGGEKKSVIQLPVSVKFFNGEIYFPLDYMIIYLENAFGRRIEYDKEKNILAFTNAAFNEKSLGKKKRIADVETSANADIYGVVVEEKINGTLIRLKSKKYVRRPTSNIFDNKLILFLLRGVTVASSLGEKLPPNKYLKKVEVKNVKGNYQIEFLLKKKFVSSDVYNDVDSRDLLITLYNRKTFEDAEEIERQKKKWKFDVVVIDPGHGGKDPGAIGYYGVKEKDVNLGVALKLGKLIKENLKGVKVVYTRKTDKFVELKKRGQIANKNEGDLFISIHCNSTPYRPTNASGFEVYLLRPGKTEEAVQIAEIENSVINYESHPEDYKNLLDENYILVAMARSAFMRYSEKFAELLSKEWPKKTRLRSRGVKQAGLYVLVGASMPGVLIETGFLTNPSDAKYLRTRQAQKQMAEAIFEAVKKYKNYYDKIFEH